MEADQIRAMLWELTQAEGDAWDILETIGRLRDRLREQLAKEVEA